MPTRAHMQIPPPKSWDEFEDIVVSALKLRWNAPGLQRYGRNGQAQQGVDIFGADEMARAAGVQCKLMVNGDFDSGALAKAVAAAEAFVPPLSTFLVATTGPRDAALQQAARKMSKVRVEKGQFSVGVIFWDDIVAELLANEAIARVHFPELFPAPAAAPPPSWIKERSVVARLRRYLLWSLHRAAMQSPGAAGQWTDPRVWGNASGPPFSWDELVREVDWLHQRGFVHGSMSGNGVLTAALTAPGRDLVEDHAIEVELGDTVRVGKSYILALHRASGECVTTGGRVTKVESRLRTFRPPGGVEESFAFDEVVVAEEFDPNGATPTPRMAELHRSGFPLADYCFDSWLGQFQALGLVRRRA